MSTGLLFVTAPEADHKSINLILLQIRDWGYGSGDSFKLVTTKNAYDLDPPVNSPQGRLDATSPPLDSSLENAWAGASLEDVEAFCLDLNRRGPYNPTLYVVVDSEGLQAHTAILGKQASSYEEDEFRYLGYFMKMRMPQDSVYMVWCNLDISNMDFEDYMQEEDGTSGEKPDGWFTFDEDTGGGFFSEEDLQRRNREIERLRRAGHI
jgi:hypothetical protein